MTGFRVRPVRIHELDEETICRWRLLEERALESNAYLSPRFVIPAVRHLAGPKEAPEILFVFVERGNGGVDGMSGVGVSLRSTGAPSLPFPHLKAFLSPGVLNEVEFIRRAPVLCGDLSYIDSGAEEGSFIDHLWNERRGLSSGFFATSSTGRRILKGVEYMRRIKRYCRSLQRRSVGHSPLFS